MTTFKFHSAVGKKVVTRKFAVLQHAELFAYGFNAACQKHGVNSDNEIASIVNGETNQLHVFSAAVPKGAKETTS